MVFGAQTCLLRCLPSAPTRTVVNYLSEVCSALCCAHGHSMQTTGVRTRARSEACTTKFLKSLTSELRVFTALCEFGVSCSHRHILADRASSSCMSSLSEGCCPVASSHSFFLNYPALLEYVDIRREPAPAEPFWRGQLCPAQTKRSKVANPRESRTRGSPNLYQVGVLCFPFLQNRKRGCQAQRQAGVQEGLARHRV